MVSCLILNFFDRKSVSSRIVPGFKHEYGVNFENSSREFTGRDRSFANGDEEHLYEGAAVSTALLPDFKTDLGGVSPVE